MIGSKYGRLLVIELVERTPKASIWLCVCDCGKQHRARRSNLLSGAVTSCGCLSSELSKARATKHGASTKRTREYVSWCQMIQRCEDPKATGYGRYGGRGIAVCARWRNDFAAFLADMGLRPQGTSLDRYPNNNGNYEPGNCRWATPDEQIANRTLSVEYRQAARIRGLKTGRAAGILSGIARRARRAEAC